jgi:hypothetical protein
MLNKIFKSGLIGFFALVMIVAFASCQKEKETIGIIIVKDSNGQVVSSASVTLFPEPAISPQGNLPDPSLTKTNNTDANGQVQFTYELEAILNIEVVKHEGNDTLQGINIIRLLKGKSVTKVVEIN